MMIKRIVLCALCLALAFSSLCTFAAGSADNAAQMPAASDDMGRPQRGDRGGGRPMGGGVQPPDMSQMPNRENAATSDGAERMPMDGFGGGMQGRFPPDMMPQDEAVAEEVSESVGIADFIVQYPTAVVSVILLGLAFVFVIFYKRKRY